MTFAGLMGLLRSLGVTDLKREGSVLKALLKTRSLEEVEVAIQGLKSIFPKGPISLRMIHGRATISAYRGWHAAYNAGITAVGGKEGSTRSHRARGEQAPTPIAVSRATPATSGPESVGAILGRMR